MFVEGISILQRLVFQKIALIRKHLKSLLQILVLSLLKMLVLLLCINNRCMMIIPINLMLSELRLIYQVVHWQVVQLLLHFLLLLILLV